MIAFFRKIRRTLVESRSKRTYIYYGVSEILLVMIGILLALQVNNWNQNRLETKTEYSYLLRLIEDLQTDTRILEEMTTYVWGTKCHLPVDEDEFRCEV